MGSKSAIGIGNGICFKQVRDKGGGSYIDPLVRDSLVGVWIADQNTNESPTRNIIKNAIKDKGGDLELLNFGYKLNSGYGKYEEDFSLFTLSDRFEYSEISNTKVTITAVLDNSTGIYHSVTEEDSALYWNTFKIKVSGSTDDVYISYTTAKKNIRLYNGINTVVVPNELSWHSFSASKANVSCNITLEFVPLYEGALVTDGKDDMIVSQKTMQEMLDDSNKMTVASMIHQIAPVDKVNNLSYNNYFRSSSSSFIRNNVKNIGKTGIYGYKYATSSTDAVTNILGDKNDYSNTVTNEKPFTSRFFVEGWAVDNGTIADVSQVAWYWTFIANRVLTSDEINQVIAYYNLDKYVKLDIYYNVKKQGLSNDTPEADWYLKDFSGNGHDMQLYNFAKKLGSGIGKYEVDFNTWIPQSYVADSAYTSNKLHITNIKGGNAILYTKKGENAMKVKITGIQSFNLVYRYIAENDVWKAFEVDRDGIYELPASTTTTKTYYTGFTVPYYTGDCDITIEQIPDYEGALVSDGIDDYGKVENLPIYKDYTVVADREIVDGLIDNADGGVAIRSYNYAKGAFGFDWKNQAFSFGGNTDRIIDVQRFISYQSKYINNGIQLITGNVVDNNPLYMARLGEENRYSKLALWSFLLFPYSLSEFLLERQLKRYKLGTLYPDMVEFRPVISGNIPYNAIEISQGPTTLYNKSINETGIYLQEGSTVRVYIQPSGIDEVSKITINGVEYTDLPINRNGYYYADFPITKSPQKISYAIDEYIRYEDIVQPYPVLLRFNDENGNEVSWGGKFRVGSTITRIGSAADSNLLPNIYNIFGLLLNDNQVTSSKVIVEKTMVFKAKSAYIFDNNEPKCILSPRLLRIPNSSYKILGYIPDISGHGNNGVIHNSAYAEGSGVNEDGSYQFDGVDDFVTIPTVTGGKQVLMKVNWDSSNSALLYDQRGYNNEFAIYNGSADSDDNPIPAYQESNNGQTYIDGILNSNIKASELRAITHNITITNELSAGVNKFSPVIGSNRVHNAYFTNMALYDFMLFDNISTDDKIKELNEYVGIEAKVELPPYYWDAYGKTNLDADKATIQQRGVAIGDYDLTNYNHAYEGMSGYNGYPIILSGTNRTYQDKSSYVNVVGDDKNVINLTRISFNVAAIFSYVKQNGVLTSYNKDIESFKIKVTGIDYSRFVIKYSYISEANATDKTTMAITSDGIYELPKSFASDGSLTSSNVWIGINFTKQSTDIPDIIEDVNVTIEVLPEYKNGLVYDGVEDYSENVNIPIVDDFTFLVKASLLKGFTGSGGLIARKGDVKHVTSGGYAFVYCLDSSSNEANRNSYYSFGKALLPSTGAIDPPLIGYMTKTSVNGVATTFGTNPDIKGINFGDWNGGRMSMVVYKSILYPKTIPLLQINFLKNLMEKDEIIDITNPIFKKEEL